MRAHVLERQFLAVLDSTIPSETTTFVEMTSIPSSTKSCRCRCPHLLRWLPHELCLDQIHGKLKNPVHALHLSSCLDENEIHDDGSVDCRGIHFGPEQVRLQALQKEGIPESYSLCTENTPIADDASDFFVLRNETITPTTSTTAIAADNANRTLLPINNTTMNNNNNNNNNSPTSTDHINLQQQEIQQQQALDEFRRRETNILAQRNTFLGKRTIRKASNKQSKRKANPDISIDDIGWDEEASRAKSKVEGWLEIFRRNRTMALHKPDIHTTMPAMFGQYQHTSSQSSTPPSCNLCIKKKGSSPPPDRLMQCLDCGYIGCLPSSLDADSKQHILYHFLYKNHSLGVTCGQQPSIYCVPCAETVHHPVFDMEHERLEVAANLPTMAWPAHPIQRSMDAFQFLTLPEHGVVWKGIMADYPSVVPDQHLRIVRLMKRRHDILAGKVQCQWGNEALNVGLHQHRQNGKIRLSAPIGLYNLGNTCFMNGVLQCLMHCVPLQDYFLRDIGHDTLSCQFIRASTAEPRQSLCLACELDSLFLKGFGSLIGKDVVGALAEPNDPSRRFEVMSIDKGMPLIPSDFLTAAWKSGGMDHLSGYEQRDAHEFLLALLDIIGKHTSSYHARIQANLDLALPFGTNPTKPKEGHGDIVKQLFEGTLRSISICEECGCKRSMSEAFLNVSLPLSKHTDSPSRYDKGKISVELCLKQFTHPESLGDPVDCPTCMTKTRTRKQHTFGRLPKILCLHLKRFDAAKNRKITDFVSFPAHGLDMGPLLPHWAEVMEGKDDILDAENGTSPQVNFDLFATLNHTGSLSQGHYVANVLVGDRWFYCNDSGVFDTTEDDVTKSDGAYVLFYIRR